MRHSPPSGDETPTFGRSLRSGGRMAKACELCGKGPKFGRQHSHAHNVSPRRFLPNIQTVKALRDGAVRRVYVCTRCLRSGKITKAPSRAAAAAQNA